MDKQLQMDFAFDTYFQISKVLREDLNILIDQRIDDQAWRRRYIKEIITACEAYSSCFRDILTVDQNKYDELLSNKERQLLSDEKCQSIEDRFKYTLRCMHTVFELSPEPNFGNADWGLAKKAIIKRHVLTHPKTITDLAVEDECWAGIEDGLIWLIKLHYDVLSLMQKKYLKA